ncbi:HEAT repeat domain-containing protein [Ktedonospora formicarum]|uniref:HEAT repeat domain-containing protein n=1 Tax=Ktedonospora formicarum TaxID=2778364 RepID=A0A8J3IDB2_9CHLR|nr:HEAT repeat domain-containing protein [Ktedonospora formicarum]GHO50163.1 hypothetical protein KSX_83260 [Ktedonospora formicarum]
MSLFDDPSMKKTHIAQSTTTDETPPIGDVSPAQLARDAAEGRRGAAWRLMLWIISNDKRAEEAVASLNDDRLAQHLLEFIAMGTWAGKPFVVPAKLRSPYARIRLGTLFMPDIVMPRQRIERVLFAGIGDRRHEIRSAAITILGEIGDRAGEPLIEAALHDPSHPVRLQAVKALGKMHDPSVVPDLLEMLKSGDEQMVNQVFAALVQIGPTTIPVVAKELHSASPWIRWHCMRALGEMQDYRGLPYLVEGLRDKDYGVAWMAAKGLVKYGKASLEPVLRQLQGVIPTLSLAETSCYVLHQLYLRDSRLMPSLKPVVEAVNGVAFDIALPPLAGKALNQLYADHLLPV